MREKTVVKLHLHDLAKFNDQLRKISLLTVILQVDE